MHPTKEASVVATARAEYVVTQEEQEVGRESVTRRTFDDNTIRFDAETTIRNVAATFVVKSQLTIEEESYFPRAYRADKTVTQPQEEIAHAITVDMFANVAVLGSEMGGRKDSRHCRQPAGLGPAGPDRAHADLVPLPLPPGVAARAVVARRDRLPAPGAVA